MGGIFLPKGGRPAIRGEKEGQAPEWKVTDGGRVENPGRPKSERVPKTKKGRILLQLYRVDTNQSRHTPTWDKQLQVIEMDNLGPVGGAFVKVDSQDWGAHT